MMLNTVQALCITLRDTGLTADADIGLYESAGVFYFRWIDAICTGMTETYKDGILLKGSFDSLQEAIDTTYGGNVARYAGTQALIDNTIQFWKKLDTLGINLYGCKAEVIDFTYDFNTSTLVKTVKFYGEVALESWSVGTYTIPIVPTLYKRNACIVKVINSVDYPDADSNILGKIVPATFGTFNSDKYAKMVRTANAESIALVTKAEYLLGDTGYSLQGFCFDSDVSIYPVVDDDGVTPPLRYRVKIALKTSEGGFCRWYYNDEIIAAGLITLDDYFADVYMKVVFGKGANTYRKVISAYVSAVETDPTIIDVILSDYFEEVLPGNATATATDQAWVQFVRVAREYEVDTFKCAGFTDDTGAVLTNGFQLFAYSDNKRVTIAAVDTPTVVKVSPFSYLHLPEYAYTASGVLSNKVEIDVKLFNDSIDNMDSFLFLPVVEPAFLPDATATKWLDSSFLRVIDGLYKNNAGIDTVYTDTGTPDNIIDKNRTTNLQLETYAEGAIENGVAIIIAFKMPTLPDGFTFDNAYILPDLQNISNRWHLLIRYCRWIGAVTAAHDIQAHNIYSIPDWYFTNPTAERTGPPTETAPFHNRNFYFANNNVSYVDGGYDFRTGYRNFSLTDITSVDAYNAITQACLILFCTAAISPNTETMLLYETTVALRKSISVADAIYTLYKGRVFDDTWNSRKTATDLIENPIDLLEHVCRLQNFNDTKTPGKEYATTPLINYASTFGGFDHASLSTIKAYRIGFQIFDENDGWIEQIKRDICKVCFLASYVDVEGKECVATLLPSGVTVSETITLDDIEIDATLGDVMEPDVKNIFCQPFVRYAFDDASQSFTKIMSVERIETGTFDADNTPGVPTAVAETVWDLCYANYVKYGHIEQPPASLTDVKMLYRDDDAAGYLQNWIYWMTRKRLEVPVQYNRQNIKSWNVGHHFYLNLPHQTNGSPQHCVVASIDKSLNSGVIKIDAVFL